MPYGKALVDTVESSGNLAITGNVTTSGTITSNTGATYPVVSGTSQNTTSGTSIDFTGIPSWAKRITVIFYGVSLSGTDSFLVQLGTSSGLVTTGYDSSGAAISGSTAAMSATNGFVIRSAVAAAVMHAQMIITNISANIWVSSHSGQRESGVAIVGGGAISLSGALTRLSVIPTGANTFDAGSVNILYE